MSDKTPDSPIVGVDLAELSQKQWEDAAEDARILMAESSIIRKLLMVDIIARRLFLLVRSGMVQELEQGWNVEQPQLVIQTLGMSAHEKAVEEPGTPMEIQQQLLNMVIPVMDIFVLMEIEAKKHDEAGDKDAQVLFGSDPGATDEVGAVLLGGEGDAELKTGECSEGGQGEDGEA